METNLSSGSKRLTQEHSSPTKKPCKKDYLTEAKKKGNSMPPRSLRSGWGLLLLPWLLACTSVRCLFADTYNVAFKFCEMYAKRLDQMLENSPKTTHIPHLQCQ